MFLKYFLLTIILLILTDKGSCANNKVIELSDRFLELRGDSAWLIMLYAPWCGHCRALEPVWGHVAQALHGSRVRVGRVDATKFTAFTRTFDAKGFPTIIFVRGAEQHSYYGDRTTASIVGFTRRVEGDLIPHVRSLPHLPYMPTATTGKEREEGGVFVYGGSKEGELWSVYQQLAERHRHFHFFYSMDEHAFAEMAPASLPAVLVHKDNTNTVFSAPPSGVNASLTNWVSHERFPYCMRVTHGNLQRVLQLDKIVALVVVAESKTGLLTTDETAFRSMLQSVEKEHREKYHSQVQFAWTGLPSLANNLAMSRLPLPTLLLLNTSSLHHHLPTLPAHLLTHGLVVDFLDSVLNGTDPALGGNSYVTRVQRAAFTATATLQDMWRGNPVLTTVLFGLPAAFLALILYSVFCGDILDASDEEEDMLREGEDMAEVRERKEEKVDERKEAEMGEGKEVEATGEEQRQEPAEEKTVAAEADCQLRQRMHEKSD